MKLDKDFILRMINDLAKSIAFIVLGKNDIDKYNLITLDLIKIADSDFTKVNIASIVAIFIIITILFKSASLPVILVATIECAIFLNLGIPYYTGTVEPFIASIVLGTIQLGATIDYAILLTSRFREERNEGYEKFEAMEHSIKSSAPSILTSALSFFK